MRRIRLTGFLILLLAATISTAAETEETKPPAKPVAVVENTEYKFTEVFEGAEVRHDFVIRNTGDAPLIINDVKSF